MAVLLIPTTTDAAYWQQKTRLDGRDYILHFLYNEREDRYYFDICDEEDLPIVRGLKCIPAVSLLRHYRYDTRIPPGDLMIFDLTGDGSPPGFGDLGEGKRCELNYIDAVQLEATAEDLGLDVDDL